MKSTGDCCEPRGKTDVFRGGLVGTCVAVSMAIGGCWPRLDDVPCATDENCSETHPYCVRGFCSAVPYSVSNESEDGGSEVADAGGDVRDAGGDVRDAGGDVRDAGVDAGRALGMPCADAGQCESGNCADGVCCDSPCNDEVCQRCDGLSAKGAGHCGFEAAGRPCGITTETCTGQCSLRRITFSCSGTSYYCASKEESVGVPSGKVCAGTGTAPVAVSKNAYCNAGEDCDDGDCQATRWWTSCDDGKGNCRPANDITDAYKEAVYAPMGVSLTSACETRAAACTNDQCEGDVLHHSYFCDGVGACSVFATTSCGKYSCDSVARQCKAQCASDSDCAQSWLCAAPECHWNWEWISWDLGGTGGHSYLTGIVIDNRSGLMWQRQVPDGGMQLDVAVGYCDALSLGGYSDWRLPKIIELLSIVSPGKSTSPAIDTGVFPGAPGTKFWTSTPGTPGAPGSRRMVNFADGTTLISGGSLWVRCVR